MSEQPLNPTPAGSPDETPTDETPTGPARTGSTAADALADATAEETTTADEAAALRAASFERARRLRMEPRFPGGPAADPAGSHHERRIRSFQPRRSRVTTGQQESLERLWPKWGLDIDGRRVLDLAELFDGLPVVLEIGFGMGEATAQMAADDPGTGILAVDVHTPGQGNLLGLADAAGSTNVRVANGDAVILLREMLAPESLDGLRVYFPDPGPRPATTSGGSSSPTSSTWSPRSSSPARSSTAPRTGSRTPSRCWRCSPRTPASRTPRPTADTPRVPRSGRSPASRARAWTRGTSSTTCCSPASDAPPGGRAMAGCAIAAVSAPR